MSKNKSINSTEKVKRSSKFEGLLWRFRGNQSKEFMFHGTETNWIPCLPYIPTHDLHKSSGCGSGFVLDCFLIYSNVHCIC